MTNIKRKKYNNFNNWEITQKYARVLHNKEVVKWFKTTNSEGRLNLRNSLLIHKKRFG